MSLSVLGNLAMYDQPRTAVAAKNGVQILVKIVSTLADENIIGRACRVIANLAVNEVAASEFHNRGTVQLLQKTIRDVNEPKSKGAAIRAIRKLCEQKGIHRKMISESNAIVLITTVLVKSEDLDLIKIIMKTLLTLTMHTHRSNGACCNKEANQRLVQQIGEETDEFKRLVNFIGDSEGCIVLSGTRRKVSRHIWVPTMIVLANLSQHSKLRPMLGNAGIIPAFVYRLQNYDATLSPKEFVQCVYALCLYCQESVNRLKLRELGGLQLFVSLLSSRESHHKAVHKKVLGSLVRFGYDNLSMKVSTILSDHYVFNWHSW